MKVTIVKDKQASIRKDGKMVRISKEVDEQLEELSEQTGHSKARIADLLLRKAIACVEVVENEV